MKRIIVLIITLNFFNYTFAQDNDLTVSPTEDDKVFTEDVSELPNPKVTFDIDIRACFTSGEFKQFYPKEGMGGFGGTVLMPLGSKNPLDVGFGLAYYFMSNTETSFQYYTPGLGDYKVVSSVSGTMFPFHLVSRIYPLKSTNFPIQPYVEGLAGFRLFIVTQDMTTTVLSSGLELEPQSESNTTGSWSYGIGGGIKVNVSKSHMFYLNAKVDQLYGSETDYMDPTSVILYDDGSYEYVNYRSKTDVLRFSIGLHLMLE